MPNAKCDLISLSEYQVKIPMLISFVIAGRGNDVIIFEKEEGYTMGVEKSRVH
jgi:hypothetical protein